MEKTMSWKGVIPALTTCFKSDLSIDYGFVNKHISWVIDNGCTGVVIGGSLGEGATLTSEEKLEIIALGVRTLGQGAPIVAGVSALSTREAVEFAKAAAEHGCRGLMVLPPYVYRSDWREMKAHVAAIFRATGLSCMLYNNPVAYGTDFLPQQIAELAAEHENLHAVKESSADVRRVTAIRALIGDRLEVLVGVDDLIVEAVPAGATGWIAGLVNAFPKESVTLFNYVRDGDFQKAYKLYHWFLPLLRLDTVVKFVQMIKLVQAEVNMGTVYVRPPRLELVGKELEETMEVIKTALKHRPSID
jgi:dihydrodipicolinate synthase/N-acetylneuraminate lyase